MSSIFSNGASVLSQEFKGKNDPNWDIAKIKDIETFIEKDLPTLKSDEETSKLAHTACLEKIKDIKAEIKKQQKDKEKLETLAQSLRGAKPKDEQIVGEIFTVQ